MSPKQKAKPSGYDKYVNYPLFAVAVGAFVAILVLPTPDSMVDVGVEYSQGKKYVQELFAAELFARRFHDLEQWQAATARTLELCIMQGITYKSGVMKRDRAQLKTLGLDMPEVHFKKMQLFIKGVPEDQVNKLLKKAIDLRKNVLSMDQLKPEEQEAAKKTAFQLKLTLGLVAFVVICFLTEAIPLPGVAFCVGLILVFSGVVSRKEVAALYWSDACWFIMGSLMFAAAFVKTGVDKRICLILFRYLARPSVAVITGILILVISPAASFISDHALAAMFLPIAIILYNNSLNEKVPVDMELAKMLVLCICMACNIGGFGSPSGGARNVIIMTYLEDMFNITMGYAEWMLYAMPFVLIMMPILWFMVNIRFKPTIRDLGPALVTLKTDIDRMGGWNRKQIIAVIIFLVMLFGWITESNLLLSLTGIRLGIGVLAMAGAMAYLLTGVVNWRDYHEKVDWGVVWLYAGAIIFGKTLDDSGAAYWIARSLVNAMAGLGLESGASLLSVGIVVTTGITNLMADGPAAAAVGPVTLNMAAVAGPGTTLIPFMGLCTSCAASFAYLLIIGTPPNAIVYASGFLEPKDFLRLGVPCIIIAFALVMLMAMFYWPALGFQSLPSF